MFALMGQNWAGMWDPSFFPPGMTGPPVEKKRRRGHFVRDIKVPRFFCFCPRCPPSCDRRRRVQLELSKASTSDFCCAFSLSFFSFFCGPQLDYFFLSSFLFVPNVPRRRSPLLKLRWGGGGTRTRERQMGPGSILLHIFVHPSTTR